MALFPPTRLLLAKTLPGILRYTSGHKNFAREIGNVSLIGRRWLCEGDAASDGANREPMVNWSQESVLVTGGTGSFGKKFIDIM